MRKEKKHALDGSKTFVVFLTFLVIIQVLVGGLLFSIFFTSIDSVGNIINSSGFWSKVFLCNLENTSFTFISISLALNIIQLIIFFILKIVKRFPPTITIVVLGFNAFVCLGVRIVFYLCNRYNIFLDFDALNILPIMSIIVSSVFVVYDYIDYYKGTYRSIQANTTLPTEDTVKETIDIIAKRAKDVTKRIDREKSTNLDNDKIGNEKLGHYRTNEGYFNNDALEVAADNMIKKTKLSKSK